MRGMAELGCRGVWRAQATASSRNTRCTNAVATWRR
jgi:hypothetical protein